jgi:NAD(P)H dehydrogenase (quinone)
MYLVTGAAGQLGRGVITHLLTTFNIPPNKIIAITRDATNLADLKSKGIDIRQSNFENQAGLTQAFAGADRSLIISTSAMEPGVRLAQHLNAVKAAENAGHSHVIYTSMPNPVGSAILFAPDHASTEKALAESKLAGYTVLRNNWYFENLLFSLPQALASGTQYTAAGQGKIAHIARDDLAHAAAAALVSKSSGKNTHTMSGSQQYTTDEIARLVSKATGKSLAVVHVPLEALVDGMKAAGLPEHVARTFASFDDAISRGSLEGNSQEFRALTGVEPTSFEDWLAKNKTAFMP